MSVVKGFGSYCWSCGQDCATSTSHQRCRMPTWKRVTNRDTASPNELLALAALDHDLAALRGLLQLKADASASVGKVPVVLYLTCNLSVTTSVRPFPFECVQLLLEARAAVNARLPAQALPRSISDREAPSLIRSAVQEGVEAVQWLLALGAHPFCPSGSFSLLDHGCRWWRRERPSPASWPSAAVVKLLVEHGADPHAPDVPWGLPMSREARTFQGHSLQPGDMLDALDSACSWETGASSVARLRAARS